MWMFQCHGTVAGQAVTHINGGCTHTLRLCCSDPVVLHVSHLLLKLNHRIGEEKETFCLLSEACSFHVDVVALE